MKKINWGIIGLGNVAQKFLEGFAEVDNARILGLSSKSNEKLEIFSKFFNVEKKFCFQKYEELINCIDIDIIYICLPNSMHYEWIIKCIENNKKVLVEKPATINFNQINEIEKKNKKKIFFVEAFMYRFHPQTRCIIDLIQNNEIGNLVGLESSYGTNLMTKKKFFFFTKKKKINTNGRLFNPKLGGGCILDLGCYPVSFSLLIANLNKMFMFDSNSNFILKNIKKEYFKTGVDIDSHLEIEFENLFTAKIKASFKKNYGSSSLIKGDKGNILVNDTWLGSKEILVITKKNKFIKKIDNSKNIYSYEIEAISNAILQNKVEPEFPAMSFNETKFNMNILNRWIDAK